MRAEICKVVRFWAEHGFDGFRIDAAPFLLEHRPDTGELVTDFDELEELGVANPYGFLDELRQAAAAVRPDAVLLAEANVDPDDTPDYFGPDASRMQVLFNFLLCEYAALALVRGEAAPLREVWATVPAPPPGGRWLNFLRNHDELNLGRLPAADREAVYAALAPDPGMRVYDRGIRRRLAPMLGGDRRRLELAYSLLFALPGIPMLRYGDEIGMGEDLALEERLAVRTPMQWDAGPTAGFSAAPADRLIRPVVRGEFGPERVSVAAQDRDPGSLLNWFRRLIAARKACPELTGGAGEPFDTGHPAVFGMRTRTTAGTVVSLHNLSAEPVEVGLADAAGLELVFADDPAGGRRLGGYGYRWLRGR